MYTHNRVVRVHVVCAWCVCTCVRSGTQVKAYTASAHSRVRYSRAALVELSRAKSRAK